MERNTLIDQIILHEGKRTKVYKCTNGYLTIGVGRNLETNGLSTEEVMFLLKNDLDYIDKELVKKLPWTLGLDDIRWKVLMDMAFNLGVNGLLKFQNTLLAIKEKRYKDAAINMRRSKWAKQVGKRAERLAKMMETGEDYVE